MEPYDKPEIYSPTIGNITRMEYGGEPVLTTAQLAEFYETNAGNISANFKNNEDRFVEGKHFFKIVGEELNILRSKNFRLQISPQTRVVYLWTKRGAARHCKSVGTDKAWEVFETLEDTYFNVEKIVREQAFPPLSNYKLAMAASALAAHAEDPYTKRKLVAKAATLLFGEGFVPEPESKAQVQLTLFNAQERR